VTIPRIRPRTLRWRVILLVSGLLLLLLTVAAVATVARVHVDGVGSRVRDTLRPAQVGVAALARGYLDMETGVRGYQLTADPHFLEPYAAGIDAVARAHPSLARLLGDDPESMTLLGEVTAAGDDWRTRAAEPAIAATREGATAGSDEGRGLFDTLRARLASLENHVNQLIAEGLASSRAASTAANITTAVCVGLAIVLGLASLFLMRRSLVRPLDRLVSQVREVSGGDLHREVEASGPNELAALGEAVEAMRARILSESEQVAESAHRIARLEETDRIARRLGDTAIRRLYGITLDLQSAAARFPRSRPVMATAITGIDRTISALRTSVYGPAPPGQRATLQTQVSEVIGELEATTGAAPGLVITGKLDSEPAETVVAGIVQVLRDLLHTTYVPGGGTEEVELALGADAIRLHLISSVPEDQVIAVRRAVATVQPDAVTGYGPGKLTIEWHHPLEPGS